MNRLINECVECKERWNVLEHLSLDELHFDFQDKYNLSHHGQLYSVCEDCSTTGDCDSVIVWKKVKRPSLK